MNNGGILALLVVGAVIVISNTTLSIFIGAVLATAVTGIVAYRFTTRKARRALK